MLTLNGNSGRGKKEQSLPAQVAAEVLGAMGSCGGQTVCKVCVEAERVRDPHRAATLEGVDWGGMCATRQDRIALGRQIWTEHINGHSEPGEDISPTEKGAAIS